MTVTEPGVYSLPADVYHADPVPAEQGWSLSVSGAKRLLPPSCPAIFKWERDNGGRPNKDVFDGGHAAHTLVLGTGAEIVTVDADSWRTKAAQEAKAAARAAGKTPLLAADVAIVHGMAAALRRHPVASALLNPDHGKPEQALFRQDESGVWLRSMLDWLPEPTNGRMLIADYKTTPSAEPAAFAKSFANYGYHMQAAWYLDMVTGLGLASDDAVFLFIAQEKTAPYLVTVYEPDTESLRIGRAMNRQAIDLYAQCTSDDHWPSYSEDVELLTLPAWYARAHANQGAYA